MISKSTITFCAALLTISTCLDGAESKVAMKTNTSSRSKSEKTSYEVTMDYGYNAGAKAHLGNADFGHISEQNNDFKFIASRQIDKDNLLRLGFDWQRFSFGVPQRAPIPNTLQAVSLVLGADIEINDEWLMRVETEPGIYSDFTDISFDDVNSPTVVGFSYLVDSNLQWFFGLSIDARREIPVLPGAGVRWKFADQWTLMFLFPKPRIEYELNKDLTLYFGGDIKAGTFKVAKNFGNQFGRPNLNNTAVEYTEFRLGPGFSWKLSKTITLEAEGGYMAMQEFNFHDADTRVVNNGGAPYSQIALKASF